MKFSIPIGATARRALLALCLLGPAEGMTNHAGRLRIAICQFPVSSNIRANSGWILRQLKQAKARGADLVQLPECALSGYAGVDFDSMDAMDWGELGRQTEAVVAEAKAQGLWVILGSTHRLSEGRKPHNSLYVIDSEGRLVDRYDKRLCTEEDLRHYSPGDHVVTFDLKGVRCGLLICYEVRFPELYRELEGLGVKAVFQSFYNARERDIRLHAALMPATAQAQAGMNHFYMALANASAPRSWPSRFLTPDGMEAGKLAGDRPGVLLAEIDLSRSFYDASGPFRREAVSGNRHSGQAVDDPRSRERGAF